MVREAIYMEYNSDLFAINCVVQLLICMNLFQVSSPIDVQLSSNMIAMQLRY